MSKFMYGVEFLREYNPDDPDHVTRQDRMCELPSGPKLLADAFDCILARVRPTTLLDLFLFNILRIYSRASKSKSLASSLANIARRSPPFPRSRSLRWRFGATAGVHLLRCGSIAMRKTFRHYVLSKRTCHHSRVVHSQSLEGVGRHTGR
jgi:hypothetical protein